MPDSKVKIHSLPSQPQQQVFNLFRAIKEVLCSTWKFTTSPPNMASAQVRMIRNHGMILYLALLLRECLMCSSPLLAASLLWLPGQLGLLQQVQQLRLRWQQQRPAGADSIRHDTPFSYV